MYEKSADNHVGLNLKPKANFTSLCHEFTPVIFLLQSWQQHHLKSNIMVVENLPEDVSHKQVSIATTTA